MELIYKKEHFDAEIKKSSIGYELIFNNETIPLELVTQSSNEFLVELNGKKKTVYVAEDKKRIYVNIEGKAFNFNKPSDDEIDYEGGNSVNQNREEIKALMPGTVIKVIVAEGDKVKEADPLIIVEAMKMETTLYASIDGAVTSVNTKEKTQVDSEDILIVIEKV